MSVAPRIAPAEAPYAPEIQAQFDKLMPPGVAPLALFRVLARDLRLFQRFMGRGLLDKGHLTLRQREIVIDRVTAQCGSEYEWGVHIAFFAAKAGFSEAERAATVHAGPERWCGAEAVLIRIADALVDDATLSDALWAEAEGHFSPAQLVEILSLVGFYHLVAFVVNATGVAREPGAPGFSAGPLSELTFRHRARRAAGGAARVAMGRRARRRYR